MTKFSTSKVEWPGYVKDPVQRDVFIRMSTAIWSMVARGLANVEDWTSKLFVWMNAYSTWTRLDLTANGDRTPVRQHDSSGSVLRYRRKPRPRHVTADGKQSTVKSALDTGENVCTHTDSAKHARMDARHTTQHTICPFGHSHTETR